MGIQRDATCHKIEGSAKIRYTLRHKSELDKGQRPGQRKVHEQAEAKQHEKRSRKKYLPLLLEPA